MGKSFRRKYACPNCGFNYATHAGEKCGGCQKQKMDEYYRLWLLSELPFSDGMVPFHARWKLRTDCPRKDSHSIKFLY